MQLLKKIWGFLWEFAKFNKIKMLPSATKAILWQKKGILNIRTQWGSHRLAAGKTELVYKPKDFKLLPAKAILHFM